MAKVEHTATLMLIGEKAREKALQDGADLNGLIRVENTIARSLRALGIAKGKKLHDKRDAIRERDLRREADREMRQRSADIRGRT